LDMLIDQRIAIIGGTTGIGFAVAKAALDAGAEVIIGSSSQTKIDEASAKFSEKATGSIIDVTEEESAKRFFKSVPVGGATIAAPYLVDGFGNCLRHRF